MRRVAFYLLPVLILAFFILVMKGEVILKTPTGNSDNVPARLIALRRDVTAEKWEEATKTLQELESAWSIVISRLQYSVERTEVMNFERNIARMKGAVEAKNKASALVELAEAEYNWRSLGK